MLFADARALVLAVAIGLIAACSTSPEKNSDKALDDLDYLTQLGLMRGHLYVGKSLYDERFSAAAKTHMKHPKSELYANLEPALLARGNVGFASELEQLASAVEQDKPSATVDETYEQLLRAIIVAEQAAPAYPNAHLQFQRVAALLYTAADEYGEGIVDGVTTMPHEYQDAYGFTEVAKQVLKSINANPGSKTNAAVDHALQQINTLGAAWPSLVPPPHVSFDSDQIAKVARVVEDLADSL